MNYTILFYLQPELNKYADWIVNHIDPHRYITHRLYRRHTVFKDAMYIKDLSMLGRDLSKTLIIDNLYESFISQPDNGILVKSWYDDMEAAVHVQHNCLAS